MQRDVSQEAQVPREMAKLPDKRGWPRRALSKAIHSRLGKVVLAATAVAALSQTPPAQDALHGAGDMFGNITGQTTPAETPEPTKMPEFNRNIMHADILKSLENETYTRSYFNKGADVTITFDDPTIPFLRTSLEADDSVPDNKNNLFLDWDNVSSINGLPVDGIKQGLSLNINNYTYAVKDNIIDNTSQKWLALDLTLKDGSNKVVFINDKFSAGQIKESIGGQPQNLSDITPQEVKTLNTTIIAPAAK